MSLGEKVRDGYRSLARKLGVHWKVVLLALLVVTTLGSGTWGFHQFYRASEHSVDCWESFLLSVGLLNFETTNALEAWEKKPLLLNLARWTGLAVPPWAIFLIIFTALHERMKHVVIWGWRLQRRRYAVVCGCGWKGAELVHNLQDGSETGRPWRVVIIDKDPNNAFFADLTGWGVITLVGDAASPEILQRAGVQHADRIYVVCNSDELNSRVASQIRALKGQKDAPPCFVHVDDPRTRYLLADKLGTAVRCFSTYDTTARLLLEANPIDRGQECKDLRIVIVGDHPMAKAMLLQILRIAHFAGGAKPTITWALPNMEEARRALFQEFPFLDRRSTKAFRHGSAAARIRDEVFPDVKLVELPDAESELMADDGVIFGSFKAGSFTSLFICLDDGLGSMALVSTVRDVLMLAQGESEGSRVHLFHYYNFPRDDHNPLLTALEAPDRPERPEQTTAKEVEAAEAAWAAKVNEAPFAITSFGKFLKVCSVHVVEAEELDQLAKEIAAFYQKEYGGDARKGVDAVWKDSEEWQRESNRQAADHIPVKLRAIGFEVGPKIDAPPAPSADLLAALKKPEEGQELNEELKMLSEMEHDRWCAERLIEGWLPPEGDAREEWMEQDEEERKEKRKKLKKKKLHGDLVPWHELDGQGQGKDVSQICSIPAFLQSVQRTVRRTGAGVTGAAAATDREDPQQAPG